LPQWNCACVNCAAARRGKIRPQTQSGLAISVDENRWLLVNASPDLRSQIESCPDLHPETNGPLRNSPIREVILTNADFDHVLGLFQLRERNEPLPVHCTPAVRDTLQRSLRIDSLLAGFCGIEWRDLPSVTMKPLNTNGSKNGIAYRAIELPAQPPRYAALPVSNEGQSVALEFLDQQNGKRLLVAPDVAAITPELESALQKADAVLFDGTFWSDDELRRIDPTTRKASEMGHLPIRQGSLEALRNLPARHRIYLHINNTNPIFQPGSPERLEVEQAGIVIGEDGLEFEL